MLVVLIAVSLAAIAGLLRGGSLDSLAATRARAVWIVFVAIAVQLVFGIWEPSWLTDAQRVVIVVAIYSLIALFLALNRQLPGAFLAAAGLMLNVIVIAANGAMPVSTEAARTTPSELAEQQGVKHEPLSPATALPWMADVIPLPIIHEVLSIGDIVLTAGITRLVYKRTVADDASSEAGG